jgi:exopolysaccharide biosynthesis glucuronosyltransferase PssD
MNKKICMIASAGGHLTQLLKIKSLLKGRNNFFISSMDVVKTTLEMEGKTYILGECNREHPVDVLKVLVKCINVYFIEKPDIVISTGAAPGLLFCYIARIFGAKIIWLDSIANVQRLSLSGQMIRPFASLVLTQWPDLAEKYKDVEYAGHVI